MYIYVEHVFTAAGQQQSVDKSVNIGSAKYILCVLTATFWPTFCKCFVCCLLSSHYIREAFVSRLAILVSYILLCLCTASCG